MDWKTMLPVAQQVVASLDDPGFLRAFFASLSEQSATLAAAVRDAGAQVSLRRLAMAYAMGQKPSWSDEAATWAKLGGKVGPVFAVAHVAGIGGRDGK